MRFAEVFGAVSAIILAFIVFSALTGPSPAYKFWGTSSERLVPDEPNTLWRSISTFLYGELFPAFIAFGLVLLTLVIGLSAMLRRER